MKGKKILGRIQHVQYLTEVVKSQDSCKISTIQRYKKDYSK